MKRIWILLVFVTVLSSCLKKNELPDQPQITDYRFVIGNSGAEMFLDFTDGDGNFGLEDADTSGDFAQCIRFYNLYAEYYELRNGVWTHIIIDPCDGGPSDPDVAFYNRVPWVKPTGQNQTQQGEIKVEMNNWYLLSDYDTIRFEVKVVDRQMNESNAVIIGPLVKP